MMFEITVVVLGIAVILILGAVLYVMLPIMACAIVMAGVMLGVAVLSVVTAPFKRKVPYGG